MKNFWGKNGKGQEGQLLIFTLLIMALGSVIIATSMTFMQTGFRVTQKARENTGQLYAAEAGAENGVWWVTKADHTSDPLPDTVGAFKKLSLVTLGNYKVQTYITYLGKINNLDTYKVQSCGGVNVLSNVNPNDPQTGPYTLVESQVTFTGTTASLFSNAIGTLNGGITLSNGAVVTCTPAPPPNNGNITANGNILGNTAIVKGNAKSAGTISGGNIAGTSSPNAGNTTFPTIDTAPYLADVQFTQPGTSAPSANYANGGTIPGSITLTGNLDLGGNKVLTVNGNLYVLNGSITLGNNAILTVNGRLYLNAGSVNITGNNAQLTLGGSLYVSGNLTTGNGTTLVIGGTVWVGGAISLGNNSNLSGAYTVVAYGDITFNNNNDVEVGTSVMPLFISTNGGFDFGNNAKVWGFLYAPNGAATISNNAVVKGAVVARSVSVSNNCGVTYVTNQRPGLPGAGNSGTTQVVSWEIR